MLKKFISWSVLVLYCSCHIPASSENHPHTSLIVEAGKGGIEKELCDNIMVVYQDKKNVYCFGSWVQVYIGMMESP